MQTEAAPREPFTLGILFRYKFTIFAVAVFVILGGYVRIITQPKQYEATARLAVRFSNEIIKLNDLMNQSLPVRLPLLEEEVKAYMVQLLDPKFIIKVLEQLPAEQAGSDDEESPEEMGTVQRFRAQFLKAYYDLRNAVMSVVDAVLFTDESQLLPLEQQVMKVLSKFEVSPGTEASHIITLTYKDKNAPETARMLNAIANAFIQQQRKTNTKKDEVKLLEAIKLETDLLSRTRERLYALTTELEAPTIEDAIVKHTTEIAQFEQRRDAFLIAQKLLNENYVPYDRSLPLESPQISGDLEREYFTFNMRFEELGSKTIYEDPKFYERLRVKAEDHIKDRRLKAIDNDKNVVKAMIARLDEEINRLRAETTIARVSPEYVKLKTDETVITQRVTTAEQDLIKAREFNKALDNENVAESIALWQAAQIPPFPVPQHRGLKLMVVIALGIFAGCAVALFRHQVLPKPLRRARPRHGQDLDVPLIIMPDKHKEEVEKDIRLDISFPTSESEEGVRTRRGPR
jgi:uncharacterized protein involved in exopolysaccharide biosynthesis